MVGVFVLVMVSFSFLNTWVNPLWITPAPWTNDAKFAGHRQISRNLRTAKAGLVRSKQWEVAFLGSSRVAIGLDPAMPEWGDRKVVNLGLSAGTLAEQVALVDYIFEHQTGLKEIYLGVDPTDLTEDNPIPVNVGFYESPLNPAGDVVEREVRYVTGISSFLASWKTMSSQRKEARKHDGKDLPDYTALGHWVRNRSNGPVKKILEQDSVPYAVRLIRHRKMKLEVSAAKSAALKRILDKCQEKNVQVKILLPPNHTAYLSVFYLDHDPDPTFSVVRKRIVELVAAANAAHPTATPVTVWDFFDFHPLNSEPVGLDGKGTGVLHYWADGTHPLETLGAVMLKRMNGWPVTDPAEAGYGQPLDAASLPARLDSLRAGFETYRQTHPSEIEWIQGIMSRYASTANPSSAPEAAEDPSSRQ